MKILGRLLLLAVLSVSALNGATINKVFGLKDKSYAEVTSKKLNKYKISDNFIFGMTMSKVDKYDGYKGTLINGMFKNHKLKNWVFVEKAFMKGSNQQLTFTDENGLNLTIDVVYSHDGICAGDQCFKGIAKRKLVEMKVLFTNNTYKVYVNDKKLYSSKKRFGTLKSFSQTFHKEDVLIDISLSEIK